MCKNINERRKGKEKQMMYLRKIKADEMKKMPFSEWRRCFPRYNRVTVDIKFPTSPSWDDLHHASL